MKVRATLDPTYPQNRYLLGIPGPFVPGVPRDLDLHPRVARELANRRCTVEEIVSTPPPPPPVVEDLSEAAEAEEAPAEDAGSKKPKKKGR